jgi:hypothetical protein
LSLFLQKNAMTYGYARVSTNGSTVLRRFAALRSSAAKVFREVAIGSAGTGASFAADSPAGMPCCHGGGV